MTYQEKAEQLVRNHPANSELMELGFGCEVYMEDLWEDEQGNRHDEFCDVIVNWLDHDEETGLLVVVSNGAATGATFSGGKPDTILGKPAQLQHYLRVLQANNLILNMNEVSGIEIKNGEESLRVICGDGDVIVFSLTTGKPATEKDAETFVKLIKGE